MRKIYKYPTGVEIPEGAVYLGTVSQTRCLVDKTYAGSGRKYSDWGDCWLVWHYFLVEVK